MFETLKKRVLSLKEHVPEGVRSRIYIPKNLDETKNITTYLLTFLSYSFLLTLGAMSILTVFGVINTDSSFWIHVESQFAFYIVFYYFIASLYALLHQEIILLFLLSLTPITYVASILNWPYSDIIKDHILEPVFGSTSVLTTLFLYVKERNEKLDKQEEARKKEEQERLRLAHMEALRARAQMAMQSREFDLRMTIDKRTEFIDKLINFLLDLDNTSDGYSYEKTFKASRGFLHQAYVYFRSTHLLKDIAEKIAEKVIQGDMPLSDNKVLELTSEFKKRLDFKATEKENQEYSKRLAEGIADNNNDLLKNNLIEPIYLFLSIFPFPEANSDAANEEQSLEGLKKNVEDFCLNMCLQLEQLLGSNIIPNIFDTIKGSVENILEDKFKKKYLYEGDPRSNPPEESKTYKELKEAFEGKEPKEALEGKEPKEAPKGKLIYTPTKEILVYARKKPNSIKAPLTPTAPPSNEKLNLSAILSNTWLSNTEVINQSLRKILWADLFRDAATGNTKGLDLSEQKAIFVRINRKTGRTKGKQIDAHFFEWLYKRTRKEIQFDLKGEYAEGSLHVAIFWINHYGRDNDSILGVFLLKVTKLESNESTKKVTFAIERRFTQPYITMNDKQSPIPFSRLKLPLDKYPSNASKESICEFPIDNYMPILPEYIDIVKKKSHQPFRKIKTIDVFKICKHEEFRQNHSITVDENGYLQIDNQINITEKENSLFLLVDYINIPDALIDNVMCLSDGTEKDPSEFFFLWNPSDDSQPLRFELKNVYHIHINASNEVNDGELKELKETVSREIIESIVGRKKDSNNDYKIGFQIDLIKSDTRDPGEDQEENEIKKRFQNASEKLTEEGQNIFLTSTESTSPYCLEIKIGSQALTSESESAP